MRIDALENQKMMLRVAGRCERVRESFARRAQRQSDPEFLTLPKPDHCKIKSMFKYNQRWHIPSIIGDI